MTINRDKYKLECEKISYLGYQISKEGISSKEMLTIAKKLRKRKSPRTRKN